MNSLRLYTYFAIVLTTTLLIALLVASYIPPILWLLLGTPSLGVFAWLAAYALYDRLNIETVESKDRIVLITGCDTGFGNATARKLDALGFHVYAGVLNADSPDCRSLQQACSPRLKIRQMDITKVEQVTKVIEDIREDIKKSSRTLWGVVNNAGIAYGCPFDWGSDLAQYERTLGVNLLGAIRVTQQAVSLLRQTGSGRIVNIGSMAGRIGLPSMASYCVSKHGLRAFTDAIRREFATVGDIQAVLIEPTFYQTPMTDFEAIKRSRAKLFEESSEETKAFYRASFEEMAGKMSKKVYKSNAVPMEVVDNIVRAVTLVEPRLFYKCSSTAKRPILLATPFVPEVVIDTLLNPWKDISRLTQRFAKR